MVKTPKMIKISTSLSHLQITRITYTLLHVYKTGLRARLQLSNSIIWGGNNANANKYMYYLI